MVYPLKSAGGVAVTQAFVERSGLSEDRRWAIIDTHGQRLRARRFPSVVTVKASPKPDGGLVLAAPRMPDLMVDAPATTNGTVPADLYQLGSLISAGAAADSWLTKVLGRSVRLVWLDDPTRRTVSPTHGGLAGEPLSLADAAPLLLTTTASMWQLDTWIATGAVERGEEPTSPLDPRRFRPNVIVDTDTPFVEDTWTRIRIGGVSFRLAEPCDRCAVTLIDPVTGKRGGKEPLRTLARYRRHAGKVWFGIRIIPNTLGTIQLGDLVISETR